MLDELARDLALTTLRCSCEYLHELRALDEIAVRMSLRDLAHNGLTLGIEYWRLRDGGEELVARGEQQIATMRRKRMAGPRAGAAALLRALQPSQPNG